MSVVWFLLVGLVAGFLARAIMPGRQQMSVPMTMLLGIVGSFVGGFVGSLIGVGHYRAGEVHAGGIIGSILGALLVLFIVTRVQRRRTVP